MRKSKLLTPDDVRNAKFKTHRFVEGYDIDDVNEFLDECENTIMILSAIAKKNVVIDMDHNTIKIIK